MISAPAPLTAAPPIPIFHTQGVILRLPLPSQHQNSPLPEPFIFQLSVTVSFKTTFPTLQDLLSLGRLSRSLVSVTFAICPLSVMMPLFTKTNFAASTYAGYTRNTRISNLRKLSRASVFWVQVPPLVWLNCSADDSACFWE